MVILVLFHFAYGRESKSTVWQRLLFSIPAGLLLVSSFNGLLAQIGEPNWVSIIFVTGIVMEQAVLIEFGIGDYVKNRISKGQPSEAS